MRKKKIRHIVYNWGSRKWNTKSEVERFYSLQIQIWYQDCFALTKEMKCCGTIGVSFQDYRYLCIYIYIYIYIYRERERERERVEFKLHLV